MMIPRSKRECHLSSWFIHSLRRLILFPGDTASDVLGSTLVDGGAAPLFFWKNGRLGGVSRDECLPMWITWAHILNCSTVKLSLCLCFRSFMMSSTSLIFLTHVNFSGALRTGSSNAYVLRTYAGINGKNEIIYEGVANG